MEHKQNWEERFDMLCLPNGVPSEVDELFGKGSISEWLKSNEEKHLFHAQIYGEPMLDLSEEKIKQFISQELQSLRTATIQECIEVIEKQQIEVKMTPTDTKVMVNYGQIVQSLKELLTK